MSEHQTEQTDGDIKNKWEDLAEDDLTEDDLTEETTNEKEPGEVDAAAPSEAMVESMDVDVLQEELRQAHAKISSLTDEQLRARAEVDNIRRRARDDVANAHKFAIENFVKGLLPVIDSMEAGLAACEGNDDQTVAKLVEGMELTLKMFTDLLGKHGVEVISPLGEKFNPERHQAMTATEKEGVEAGHVIEVFQKGYFLSGRVIRPAMVVVSK